MEITVDDDHILAHLVLLKVGVMGARRTLDMGAYLKPDQAEAMETVIELGKKLIDKLEEDSSIIGPLSDDVAQVIMNSV